MIIPHSFSYFLDLKGTSFNNVMLQYSVIEYVYLAILIAYNVNLIQQYKKIAR